MSLKATVCSKCGSRGLVPENSLDICICGGNRIAFNLTEDEYCKLSEIERNQMTEQMGIKPLINKDDALVIYKATKSTEIIDAMIELKQRDIIEYGLKLSQFRTQLSQQQSSRVVEENKVRCPKCKSTSITTGARGVNFTFGLLGASKTVNRCANCGHTWKP